MKKYFIIASVLFLAVACQKQPPVSQVPVGITAELGQSVTLKKSETAVFKNSNLSLTLLDFYYHPCPPGAQCIWSGLDVYYKLSVGGQEYKKDSLAADTSSFPYRVSIKDSDYQTFATLVVEQNNQPAWNPYTSPSKYGFSIKYPKDFAFTTDLKKASALSYIPVCAENMAACIYQTREPNYTGTNLEAAGVSINILPTLDSEAKCYNFSAATNETQAQAPDVTINGVVFKSATGGGGAAGHFSKAQSYRNFYNSKCYEVYQSLVATNIANYPTGTVKEFNQDEVWQKLQGIVNTFGFTSAVAGNLQVCPQEWWEDDMPSVGVQKSPEQRQYYILDGKRRELSEFNADWVSKNCNLQLQHAY